MKNGMELNVENRLEDHGPKRAWLESVATYMTQL